MQTPGGTLPAPSTRTRTPIMRTPVRTTFIATRYIKSGLPVRKLHKISHGIIKRIPNTKKMTARIVRIMNRELVYGAAQPAFPNSFLRVCRVPDFGDRVFLRFVRSQCKRKVQHFAIPQYAQLYDFSRRMLTNPSRKEWGKHFPILFAQNVPRKESRCFSPAPRNNLRHPSRGTTGAPARSPQAKVRHDF